VSMKDLLVIATCPRENTECPRKIPKPALLRFQAKKGTQEKASPAREKCSLASTTTTNDRAMEKRAMTPKLGAGQVAYFQLVTQIGDNRPLSSKPMQAFAPRLAFLDGPGRRERREFAMLFLFLDNPG